MNDNKTYPNTQTFLIEASRGDSIIDNKDNNDYNSKWSTETAFQLKRGDTVSVEMVALNAQNAGSSQTIEFTGEKVIVDGKQKKYCDNKVLLEVFYYINNNNTYSVGLPLLHPEGSFCNEGAGSFAENKCQPAQYGTLADGINNRGFTYTPGTASFLNAGVIGTPPNAYVGPVIDAGTCHQIVALKDFTGTYVSSVGANVDEIVGVVLAKSGDGGTGLFTDYASWFGGKWGFGELCNIYPNMMWGVEDIGNNLELNSVRITEITEQTAALPGGYAGTGRVELTFASRTTMSALDTVASGSLFGLNWEDEKQGTSEIGLVNYDNINSGAFLNYPPYVAKNRNLGHYMENITNSSATYSPQYKYFKGGAGGTVFFGGSDPNLISVAKGDFSQPSSNPGFRCGQPRHDNNGKPYILTRNDWCGQGRREVNSGDFLPKLEPLSAFILLEAEELFTDVNALAQTINDKLHETLNLFDTEVAEQDNFLTNSELYPHLNTKTSSILPTIQTNGYVDPALGAALDENYKTLYDAITPVKSGGTVKIQPANFDDGVNMLYQSSRMTIDDTTPDYIKSTYIKKCPNPNLNTEAIENPIYGNSGYLNFYKAQLGDRWQRISLNYLNTVASRKPAPAFGKRNCGKPVILNEKLLYKDVTLTSPGGFSTVKTTTMKKSQLIFTNLNYPQKDSDGNPIIPGLEQQLRDLATEIRKYEIYNNKVNGSNSYAKQEKTLDWVFDFDIGITNDNKCQFLQGSAVTTDQYSPMTMPWTDEYPASTSQATDPTYGTGMDGTVRELICPSFSTPGFGVHHTNFYWLTQFSAYRPLGHIYIESRFDPNYFVTSQDMNKITGGVAIDANCQLIDGEAYKKQNYVYPDMELIKELNIGLYPYEHIDEDGTKEIFIAIRCGEDYEAFSENPLSVQLGCMTWGSTIGVSPSSADNHMIAPMNADFKNPNREFPIPVSGQVLNRGLRPNRNNMIWCGANNPTFEFNSAKNRYEFVNLQSDQLLSSLNTAQSLGGGVSSQLGDKVGIVNSITVDAVFNSVVSRGSVNKGVRDAISGVGVYKIWLCPPDYNPPPNINLVNYWDNSTLTKTQENHDAITNRCIQASPTEWEGSLLDRCGFDYYSLFPKYGYQFNRFDPNTYNNEDPKVIGQGVKPLILNNSVNNVTNPSLSLYFDPMPTPAASAIPSGVPNFGLGMYNNQSVLLSTQSLPLTATASPILTTSPFYIIYSDIVGERNYQSGSTPLPAVFYCMRNYSNSGFFYGYGSTFQIMINQDRHLSLVNTEIRNPNGELAKLSKNSTIMYKIQRQAIVPPPQIDVFGQLENQQMPDPNQQELMEILQNTKNMSNAMAGGSSVPTKGGTSKITGGGGIGTRNTQITQTVSQVNGTSQTPITTSTAQGSQASVGTTAQGIQAEADTNEEGIQASVGTEDQQTQSSTTRRQSLRTTQDQMNQAVEEIEELQNTDVQQFTSMIDAFQLSVDDRAPQTRDTGVNPNSLPLTAQDIGKSEVDRKIVELIIRGIMSNVARSFRTMPPPTGGDDPNYNSYFPISLKKGEKLTNFIALAIRQVFTKLDIDALLQMSDNDPGALIGLLTDPAQVNSNGDIIKPAGIIAGLNINSEGRVTFNPAETNPKLPDFQLEAAPMSRNPQLAQIVDMVIGGNLNRYSAVGKSTYTKLKKKLELMNAKGNINGIFKANDEGLVLVYPDINPGRPQDVSFIQENINDPILPEQTQSVDQTIDQLNEMDFMYVTEKGILPQDALGYYQMLGDEIKPQTRLTRAEAEVRRMKLAARQGRLPEYEAQMLQKQLAAKDKSGGSQPRQQPTTDGSGGGQPPPQSQSQAPNLPNQDMDI